MKKRSLFTILPILLFMVGCSQSNSTNKELRILDSSSFEVLKSSKVPSDYLECSEGNRSIKAYHSDQAEDVSNFSIEYQRLTGEKAPVFDGNMIIAKSGTKFTGGYDIDVKSVKDGGRYTEVTVVLKSPGKGCIVTTALTNPYIVVKIDGDHKDVKFIEEDLKVDCK